jgi:PKD repeat protein
MLTKYGLFNKGGSMTIGRYVIVLFVLLLALGVPITTGDTLYIRNATVQAPGDTVIVNIMLDEAPMGLSGYNLSVTLLNPGVGEIVGVTFPDWATFTTNSSVPADTIIIRGVDSGQQIVPPSYNVSFGTLTLRGDQAGTSILNITINILDDFNGSIFMPEIRPGTFTVGTPVTPTPTSPPQLPHMFYGTAVLANGEDAPAGTLVDAYGTGVTIPSSGNPVTITVPGIYGGSDPLDQKLIVQGSILPGDPIEFYIDDIQAQCYDVEEGGEWMTTYPFQSGAVTELNLRISPEIPQADFAANVTQGISPLSVDFTDLSTGIVTAWEWNFGDGSANVTDKNPEHTFTAVVNTTYTVTLTVSNGAGSSSKSDYITVNVLSPVQPPVADFTSSQSSGAAPLIVQFNDLSTNAPDSWSWSFGDGDSSAEQNPFHTYSSPGTYTVTLTVSNAAGTDTIERPGYVIVDPDFYASFDAAPVSGDAPLTVTFTDRSRGDPLVVFYDFGDGSTARARDTVHTFRHPGTYDVSMTIWKSEGGRFISTQTVKQGLITVSGGTGPVLTADFTAAPVSGTAPLTVSFTDMTTGDPRYWSYDFGDGLSASSRNPVHTYKQPGTYTVKLTVLGFGPHFSLEKDSITKGALITVT